MEFLKRKPVRLIGYDYSQNGAYFLTICTHKRERLFGEIVGDDAYVVPKMGLNQYGSVVEKYINRIEGVDKFVIMPNHIHIIIHINLLDNGTMRASSPTKQSISQLIKSFKIMVTKEIGFSIFQRSFHDHIIRSEEEYQKIWQYVDTNPSQWTEDCFYNSNTVGDDAHIVPQIELSRYKNVSKKFLKKQKKRLPKSNLF